MWFQVWATSHIRSRLERQHQSVPGCAEECGDPLVQSGGRWQTLGVGSRTLCRPTSPKRPRLASEGVLRLCTLLSLAPLSSKLNPLDYFVWSYVENITSMALPQHQIQLDRHHPPSIRPDAAGACGKGMLPVPNPY